MYSVHPDYYKLLPRYQTIRDCINDDVAYVAPYVVGGVTNTGRRNYLIRPASMSDDNYTLLCQFGEFMNVTGRALSDLMGFTNKTPPVTVIPVEVEYLIDNADGDGNGLESITKKAMSDTTALGRIGVLVEAPRALLDSDGNVRQASQADVSSGKARTTAKVYEAESILDYDISVVNDVKQLSFVKLSEKITVRNTKTFQVEEEMQYRFLILTDDGYEQRLFEDMDGTSQIGETTPIRDYNGKQMQKIEFYFAGSVNNDATADNPPLLSLAKKNVALYNLDASNRINLNLYATGSLFVTGDAKDLGGKNLAVGGGSGTYLGETGSVELLQLQAGTALPEAIRVEKEDMAKLGADLLDSDVSRTLGEAELSASKDVALLSTVTQNVQLMMRQVIQSIYMLQTGKELPLDKFEFTLNKKFFSRPLSAQERQSWLAEIMSGVTPKTLYYKRLREAEEIPADWTDEQIDEAIEPQNGIIE